MEVEEASRLWTARERVLMHKMEKYLEKSEKIQVEVNELESWRAACWRKETKGVDLSLLAELALDEGGCHRFVLLDTPRGKGGDEALKWLMQHVSQKHVRQKGGKKRRIRGSA